MPENIYTPEQAVQALKSIMTEKGMDTEYAHIKADNILCELLTSFGCQEVVDAYEDIPKWFA